MAEIRVRFGPRDIRTVDVADERCPQRSCFWATRHTIRSNAGFSGCSSRTTNYWTCGRREQGGCPQDKDQHFENPPRYQKRNGIWRECPHTQGV